MGGKSSYLQNAWLNYQYGGVSYTPPATVYVALFTVAPGEAGGGTEISGNNYARVALTNNTTNFPTVNNGVKTNGTAITFPTASGNQGTAVAWATFDAASSGNMLHYGDLTPNKVILTNDAPTYPIGALTIIED